MDPKPGFGRCVQRTLRLLGLVLVLLGVGSPGVLAQPNGQGATAPDSVLNDPRVSGQRDQLQQRLAQAQGEGLPSEWLLDKVREGLAKRAPGPRIAGAVDALHGRMRAADQMLRRELPRLGGRAASAQAQRQALMRVLVDALAAGAPEAQMGQLVRNVVRGGAGGPAVGGPAADGARAPQGKGLDRGRQAAAEASERIRRGAVTVAELGERGFEGGAAVQAAGQAYDRAGPEGWTQLLNEARQIRQGDASQRSAELLQASSRVAPGRQVPPAGSASQRRGSSQAPAAPGAGRQGAGSAPKGGPGVGGPGTGTPGPGASPGAGPGAGPRGGPSGGPQGRPGSGRGMGR